MCRPTDRGAESDRQRALDASGCTMPANLSPGAGYAPHASSALERRRFFSSVSRERVGLSGPPCDHITAHRPRTPTIHFAPTYPTAGQANSVGSLTGMPPGRSGGAYPHRVSSHGYGNPANQRRGPAGCTDVARASAMPVTIQGSRLSFPPIARCIVTTNVF